MKEEIEKINRMLKRPGKAFIVVGDDKQIINNDIRTNILEKEKIKLQDKNK